MLSLLFITACSIEAPPLASPLQWSTFDFEAFDAASATAQSEVVVIAQFTSIQRRRDELVRTFEVAESLKGDLAKGTRFRLTHDAHAANGRTATILFLVTDPATRNSYRPTSRGSVFASDAYGQILHFPLHLGKMPEQDGLTYFKMTAGGVISPVGTKPDDYWPEPDPAYRALVRDTKGIVPPKTLDGWRATEGRTTVAELRSFVLAQ